MKKIVSQYEREKKVKKNKIIVGAVMTALIVLSSIGYALMSREDYKTKKDKVEYNGFSFVKSSDFWRATIDEKDFYFGYLPSDLNDTIIDGEYSLSDYYEEAVYFVNPSPASSQIVSLIRSVAQRVQEACVDDLACADNTLPVKNCSDNIFIYKENDEKNIIYKRENCVFIEGDFFKGSDKVVYKLLGVIR